ncbi:MAG: FAD-binding protein [Bifidobacteriaceae bacterium]|nr:FAD-binding protein [Bifidobacteriaceae bacterium]
MLATRLPLASPAVRVGAPPALSQLTTFRLGGHPARIVDCDTDTQVISAIADSDRHGRRILVLGGGSNLVVADRVDDLIVVRDRRSAVHASVEDGRVRVSAQAGAAWDALVEWTTAQGWAALAPLSGIPGSVGALAVQNVGAYGASASDVISLVRAYDRATGQVGEHPAQTLAFGYRDSALKRSVAQFGGITPRWVVLEVVFDLGAQPQPDAVAPTPSPSPPGAPADGIGRVGAAYDQPAAEPGTPATPADPAFSPGAAGRVGVAYEQPGVGCGGPVCGIGQVGAAYEQPGVGCGGPVGGIGQVGVNYDQLAAALGVPVGSSAPGAAVRAAVLAIRRSKGMVLDAADHDTWSAGSYFTNPFVTPAQAAALPADAPRFEAAGQVKTSAAWLMTQAGIGRGYGIGDRPRVTTSTKHVLALTNRGGANAADVLEFERWIVDRVRRSFGIALTREPVLIT